MESNELRIFRTVAQTGSITKAAKALGYVQSNVTARIQQLESDLNTQLFYRQRGMILTPTGEKLLTYADKIIYLLDEADKSIKDSCEPSGSLSIGAVHTVSAIRLPQLLAKYHRAYPKVDLSLTTSQSDELIYKVNHFQLDGAFVKNTPLIDDNFVKELEFEETLVLISNPKYTNIEDLYCKPLIMSTAGCPNRIQLENWLKSQGIYNIRYIEFNNLNSIIEGVMADLGTSLVPKSTIDDYEKRGLIKSFSISEKYNTTRTFFIRRKDSLMTSSLSKFIEIVEQNTSYKRL
ncbi:DNA-binding transcriptional LysR family regulator [Clostridium saccharoperbutylacetonicum]|jgi:DNA-binding transcriptional LysR family regulator|uniref:Transcriptional regulator n=1 Tax=Clostridium saccharoperbutylacetonicum N1-4(HMT) TaxID=931276 RepID=M1MVS4_9CLOT|nr:LysR family transcriptional regulator [Clostridium saccharoperbutylacetonicum]AGF58721.1 transcriptional regulator [Clostridium saccharoperbutylacetonicum N1-4(HMT)]NRT60500.1 DNA-binding transcriptional LysR family regulator [Clostridium saccharoperbutylacetonicum]NSB23814.1 DNA-binding transcriptional LysR family regulator [Clostridium saccharoperbutylacetonicum]NSB43190.1 DNA-binding transcriptional LysR family regulator [Clostridium saccharoperbutylacetonicum]